jgi:uncharacterized protein YukE
MSTDVIKLDYGLAENMKRTFEQGKATLEQTNRDMAAVAQMLEQGALLGEGGEAFVAAVRGPLTKAIGDLSKKFDELARDVQKAVDYMREADKQSANSINTNR